MGSRTFAEIRTNSLQLLHKLLHAVRWEPLGAVS
jgi:hypothetical protein